MPEGQNKGHEIEAKNTHERSRVGTGDDFVLEKSIFSNIFEKDIRRVFIYKKAERLAKAVQLIAPAFADAAALKDRLDAIAIGLVDGAIRPPAAARVALSSELLALSSILSIARTGGLLSTMNAELIAHEAQLLLQEIAAYEEPRVFLDDAPTLAEIARGAGRHEARPNALTPRATLRSVPRAAAVRPAVFVKDKSAISDSNIKDRKESIMSVIRSKGGQTSIKDVSTIIRGVSEKTIQRELQALVEEGRLVKRGERRWSTYVLA